jgi:hypothetical protein
MTNPETSTKARIAAALVLGGLGIWGVFVAYVSFWTFADTLSPIFLIPFAVGLGLMATALHLAWPVIRRRRGAQIGLGLVVAVLIAWAAVRFVVPPMLGWPAVSCGPGTTRADCLFWEDHLRAWTTIDLFLPVTEVTIYGYGTCDAVSRISYLGGLERPGAPGGLC